MFLSKKQEKGQGLVEYALILVLVSVVVLGVLTVLGPVIGNVFTEINSGVAAGGGGGGGGAAVPTATPSTPNLLTFTCIEDPSYPSPGMGLYDVIVNGSFSTWGNCTPGASTDYSISSFPIGANVEIQRGWHINPPGESEGNSAVLASGTVQ